MTIKIGDKIPSITLKHLTAEGMQDLSTSLFFADKNVVLFAVPGAFTPTCSAKHLPGYVQALAQFKALGISIACLSVNDPFVMKAWSDAHKAEGITFLPDGNASLTKALGLETDSSAYGMATRSQRFALYAENSVVKSLAVEKSGAFEISSAEAMLATISGLKQAA